jgi:hypothetical protein
VLCSLLPPGNVSEDDVTRTPACFCLALLCVAACGGDIGNGGDEGGQADAGRTFDAAPAADAAPGCGTNGGGSVTSATAGAEVEPVVSAWYQIIDPEAPASALVIDERASNCDPDAISDQPGQFVTIYFCSELAAGAYQAVPALTGPCPDNPQVNVTVQNELLQDLVSDTTGTFTIDATGDCITGSFDTTSADGKALSGSFRAYPCPTL